MRGRSCISAQSLRNDLRSLIIASINEMWDVLTGEIPCGVLSNEAEQCKAANTTVKNIWDYTCCHGTADPLPSSRG